LKVLEKSLNFKLQSLKISLATKRSSQQALAVHH